LSNCSSDSFSQAYFRLGIGIQKSQKTVPGWCHRMLPATTAVSSRRAVVFSGPRFGGARPTESRFAACLNRLLQRNLPTADLLSVEPIADQRNVGIQTVPLAILRAK
jgi:hypothetical protein